MKLAEWMRFFRGNRGKRIFSLSDLSQMTGQPRASLLVQLSRLEKEELLDRVAQGWYGNPFAPPSPEGVAMVLRHPAYLSLEYALSKHGVLSQNAFTLTLATTRPSYTYRTGGTVYEYHQLSRHLFWGFAEAGGVATGEPEKALADLVYVRAVRGRALDPAGLASLLDDMYLEDLDPARLACYAARFGPATEQTLRQAWTQVAAEALPEK